MNRTAVIKVRFTLAEYEKLSQLAARQRLKLGTFAHQELTRCAHISRDTAILAGEIGRLRELVKRGWEQAGVPMREVSAVVSAIDARVFVAELEGMSLGE
jgi:hypothetical protein